MDLGQRKYQLALLLLILLAAATLRLWRLDDVPPGFTHDEAGHGHDAIAILDGARPIYQTVGYGREPLYDYWVAGWMALFGPTGTALRFASVLLGLATLLLTYAWGRLAFDTPTALATLALQAASFWSLATSRQALRSGLLPALFTAAIYFYWRFFRSSENSGKPLVRTTSEVSNARFARRSVRWSLALFALLLGATLYTYIPARVLWLLFPAFLIYLALIHRPAFRRVWRPTLLAVAIALFLALPLFAYLRAHPGAEQRLDMLDEPLDALSRGDLSVVLDRTRSALAGLLLPGQGDAFLAYNIPGRPILDWPTGVLFLVGLALCLARWRDPARAFALLWLLVGLAPALITGATASITRAIGAMPVLFLFAALAVVTGVRWVAVRWGSQVGWAATTAFIALVLVNGAFSARGYFVTWGRSPDVRAAYQHTLVEMAGYLEAAPQNGTVALSSLYPNAPHDPYILDLALRREDLALRCFDARRALLVPPEPSARLLTPSSAPLDPYFAGLPGVDPRERVTLLSDDLDPYYVVYDWEPPLTLAALRERAAVNTLDLALPANFGAALELLGYDLRTPAVPAGGIVELVTLWQVTDPQALRSSDAADPADIDAELVLFTHALDGAGTIVGQEDRVDAPSWDWQAGDVIAQIHRFPVQGDLPSGTITLEVGAYYRGDLARLPVLVDGAILGDRVLLVAVEVNAP
jgi:hypothetical protein